LVIEESYENTYRIRSGFCFVGSFCGDVGIMPLRGNLGNEKETGQIVPREAKMMANNYLGKMLKRQRLVAELTLRELAARSGVSQSHLARIERGERFPSAHILRKIAKPLGFDESQLLIVAGYLSPQPPGVAGEEYDLRRLDPYVARVLSEEPVHIQRAVLSLLTIVKAIAKAF